MFKLTIVNGPERGKSFNLRDAQNNIGRLASSDIALNSQRISKQHCIVFIRDEDVSVQDTGSSNGTFVNGLLTKSKKLSLGDRISVGEFVLELTKVEEQKISNLDFSNVVPLRAGIDIPLAQNSSQIPGSATSGSLANGLALPPKDLKEKIKFYFEKYIINFVYTLNEKHQWRMMLIGMFIIMTIGGAVLSIYPTLERVNEKLELEVKERAMLLSRQMVDRNSGFIYEKLDSKVDVGFAEKEKGVLAAYIVDMEGRVLAPGRKLNQYLTESYEASFSATTRKLFNEKEKLEEKYRVYGDVLAVATPLRIFSAASGKNVTVALGLVFFDRTQILFDSGTVGLTYIQAMILCAIIAVILYFSMYRLTLRPLQNLNDEVDQVLKGNLASVSHKYKMEEIDPLIDVINAALQRLPSAGNSVGAGDHDTQSTEEILNTLKFVSERMLSTGMMVLSPQKKILYMNTFMEELTGIRAEIAVGDEIANVAREAAFHSFVEDLFLRAQSSFEPISEDFEFSGTSYKVECVGVGQPGSAKGYVFTASKAA